MANCHTQRSVTIIPCSLQHGSYWLGNNVLRFWSYEWTRPWWSIGTTENTNQNAFSETGYLLSPLLPISNCKKLRDLRWKMGCFPRAITIQTEMLQRDINTSINIPCKMTIATLVIFGHQPVKLAKQQVCTILSLKQHTFLPPLPVLPRLLPLPHPPHPLLSS